MKKIHLYTIGYTQRSAEDFFETLKHSEVQRVLDVRRNNTSQIAGFSKKGDLKYFLQAICGMEYYHMPELAPTEEMLVEYKKNKCGWDQYEKQFLNLLEERQIEEHLTRELIDGGCLLCSEREPEECHRRTIAEYLEQKWTGVEVEHLI